MNKILYKARLGKVKDVVVGEDYIKIIYSKNDKIIKITSSHCQDCCESVYADWEMLKYHIDQLKNLNVENLEIKAVKEMGFLLCFEYNYGEWVKIFVPCYNEQNGYYGDDLALEIVNDGKSKTIDISDLTEGHIG